MFTRNSRQGQPGRRADSSRAALGLALVALLAAPAGHAGIRGCPEDQEAILKSARLLRSDAARKRILDSLGDCLSVSDFVKELRSFRPSPAQGRAFRELAARTDLDEKEAKEILHGSQILASMRTRQAVVIDLIGTAKREDLLRAAGTLPGPLLQEFLQRLVEYETAFNDPPVAQDQSLSTRQGTPIEIRLTTNETGYIAFTIVTLPARGTLEVVDDSPHTVRYRPEADFTGTDSFMFAANDGELDSAEPGTVTIRVGRQR